MQKIVFQLSECPKIGGTPKKIVFNSFLPMYDCQMRAGEWRSQNRSRDHSLRQ